MSFHIILIIGAARSGSTIASMHLAQQAGHDFFGELTHYWDRGLAENHLCGCGERFLDCQFWTNVRDAVGVSPKDGMTIKNEMRALLSHQYSINPFSRQRGGRFSEIELKNHVSRLYHGLAVTSGARYIVDSSKKPIYARFLVDVFGPDRVSVVHLVRDPRGVSYSQAKTKPKTDSGDAGSLMIRRNSFKSTVSWLKENYSAVRLAREVKLYKRIRYEDYCRDPEAAIAEISGKVPPDNGGTGLVQTMHGQHSVSGNPVRVSREPRVLRLDEEWRTNMPWLDWAVVTFISAPLRLYFWLRPAN